MKGGIVKPTNPNKGGAVQCTPRLRARPPIPRSPTHVRQGGMIAGPSDVVERMADGSDPTRGRNSTR